MILAFLMLFAGGMIVGAAYSFHKSGRPLWMVIVAALIGLLCIGVSLWRIQM
ncbi:hypothetical protein Bequi_04565 [Brachybacterium sp. JHP9]|uniref:Amidotransferase n=1 Tax=Brachybacterium equifaecis TaxID=2910770 RepID=A0ABT0QYH3_9MICO|nr:hypothetical protein [Brachybacterium equifaecis]MCL6422666.1 hypothetical protein [Brachybacterium equifaecis]